MRSRAYASVRVNDVDAETLARGHDSQDVVVGMDIGKYDIKVVCRWPNARFERPWSVNNPSQIASLVRVLQTLGHGRQLRVALEPSGTYGDALRQALQDGGLSVERVSPKAAHDYAEIFDGVPSQHDGKDAAVVAELAALGKSTPWPYAPPDAWRQEMAYWVDELEYHRRVLVLGLGRIEALLARHWPEATRTLSLSSGTLLRVLATYGGPAALAADVHALEVLQRWGGKYLTAAKAQELLAGARNTVGVRQGEWDRQLRVNAERARAARQAFARSKRRLQRLARDHAILQAQGAVVGVPTACVLWTRLGDPRDYACAGAYRKAMGLNLTERSSGTWQGKLRISKRGHPQTRQWLYLATLRLIQRAGVQPWYQAKKARDGDGAKRALVAVMRKLALALYHVGARGATFDARRLFARIARRREKKADARTASRGTGSGRG